METCARTALVVGLASILGVEIGARIATGLPRARSAALRALLFVVAAQLVWRTRRARPRYPDSP